MDGSPADSRSIGKKNSNRFNYPSLLTLLVPCLVISSSNVDEKLAIFFFFVIILNFVYKEEKVDSKFD